MKPINRPEVITYNPKEKHLFADCVYKCILIDENIKPPYSEDQECTILLERPDKSVIAVRGTIARAREL